MYEYVEKSGDDVQMLTLSFHHAGPRHQTKIITLGGRNLCLPSQLPPHTPPRPVLLFNAELLVFLRAINLNEP